jgi:hypothetical protein
VAAAILTAEQNRPKLRMVGSDQLVESLLPVEATRR